MREVQSDPRFADPLRLEPSGFKVHSQYDEDGIIAEIFRRIGTTNRVFVEFGCGNGTQNCTGFLLMQDWRGLWIDGDPKAPFFIKHIWKPQLARAQLVFVQAFITVDTIDDVIRSAGFSGDVDLLVVDIDGNDYHVLEKINAIAPRVICAEYNSNYPPSVVWAMERDDSYAWDMLDYQIGASLKALEQLLARRGYALVGCGIAGVNAFFVRQDLVADKFAAPFTAENHYHAWRYAYGASMSDCDWPGWRDWRRPDPRG